MIGHYEFWNILLDIIGTMGARHLASNICPCNSQLQTQSYVSEREIFWNGCGPVSWSGWLNLVKAQLWFTYIWIKRTKTSRGVSLSCIFSAVNLISGVALWALAPSNADTGNAPRLQHKNLDGPWCSKWLRANWQIVTIIYQYNLGDTC